MNKPFWVVIPAAGVGQRMQADRPKQYLQLHDKTVLEHTLDCFLGDESVSGVVVVVSKTDGYWPTLSERFQASPVYTVYGGKERADSVLNGLDYLYQRDDVDADTVVLVHDAARPCLPRDDLQVLLAAADESATCGALLAVPVRDTMKRALPTNEATRVAHTEDREGLWHALTPQMAALGILRDALRTGLAKGAVITDEASALENTGLHPRLLEGSSTNIKITRPADLALASFFLQQRLAGEES